MLLLVGLGNPGQKYQNNRHNIGFMAVDSIADIHGFGPQKSKFSGIIREGQIDTDKGPKKTLILKPQTFMNESGRAVGKAAQFYKIPKDDIIVFHDELDLEPGKLRVKTGGGIAGHNGLRSIRQHMGPDFHRVRLGIGHPGHKDRVHGYVLSDFSKSEMNWVQDLNAAIAQASGFLPNKEFDKFQTRVATLAPAPERAKHRGGKKEN